MLIARLIDVKLLPSPGTALVTMMRLARAGAAAPVLLALLINGRLRIRNSSATCERGAFGVTILAAARRAKSNSIRGDRTNDGVDPSAEALRTLSAKRGDDCSATSAGAVEKLAAIGGESGAAVEDGPIGVVGTSGAATPACRSCSSRWAACSIKLLI